MEITQKLESNRGRKRWNAALCAIALCWAACSRTPPPASLQTVSVGTAQMYAPEAEQRYAVSILPNARVDLARLRVDKWKADNAVKQQTTSNIESLQRNLSGALPTLVAAAQQNPSSLNASFKLYRNLNVLYDVLGSVAESAGAFGAREEYSALAQDLNNLDTARRSLADAMDAMTAQRDADFVRIQQATQRAQQQAAAAPPKRVVIDDTEPTPKPTVKKKKSTSSSAPTATPKQ